MATYAIGDIQGCYKTLKRLLKRISFNRKQDRIFLVGDLVNRGPNSLDVLRWAKDSDRQVVAVLGNHDLHLLAIALGVSTRFSKKTLEHILRAKDRDDLLEWLVKRPLIHKEGRLVLVHAGILPAWSIDEAMKNVHKTEKLIRSKKAAEFLKAWHKSDASKWSDNLEGFERHAVVLNACTRMRLCRNLKEMDLSFTGPPEDAPAGLKPWFGISGRKSVDHTVIFGHWSALGVRVAHNVIALDSGCVWGGTLTALRLEDGAIFSEPSAEN